MDKLADPNAAPNPNAEPPLQNGSIVAILVDGLLDYATLKKEQQNAVSSTPAK